jgi:hypothetical protein
VAGRDLDVAQVHAGIEHGGDERVAQHVRGQPAQPAGGGVPVHPGPTPGAQDWPHRTGVDGEVDRASDRGRQGDEDDLAALADHAQDTVAVLLPQIGDIGTTRFEDA